MIHPIFEIVKTTAGAISIRNKLVNEIMHNPIGPWAEAMALYVDQSGLKKKLSTKSLLIGNSLSKANLATNDSLAGPNVTKTIANVTASDDGVEADLDNIGSSGDKEELVLFDVGLGAAANALAAIHCARQLVDEEGATSIIAKSLTCDSSRPDITSSGFLSNSKNSYSKTSGSSSRPLRIISFERDLELLKFALQNSNQFAHFQGYEQILQQMIDKAYWSSQNISWELRHGDFLELIKEEVYKPHIIFFDPYSPKVNQGMWTSSSFSELFNKCRSIEQGGTVLYTYSQATRIRTAMLQAGFFVGYGEATGLKMHTTEAATDKSLLKSPLDWRWYERWQRSSIRYPFDCLKQDQIAEVDAFVEKYFTSQK